MEIELENIDIENIKNIIRHDVYFTKDKDIEKAEKDIDELVKLASRTEALEQCINHIYTEVNNLIYFNDLKQRNVINMCVDIHQVIRKDSTDLGEKFIDVPALKKVKVL